MTHSKHPLTLRTPSRPGPHASVRPQATQSDNNTDQGQSLAAMLRSRRKAITAEELAEVLSVSVKYIYKAAAAKRIPSMRFGSMVRFDPKITADWVEGKRIA